ncbi:MAG: ribonuclease R [Lachnospiraceae bacterium]|nr:ribonuclease R [Lachnospiraceae bacterium]
MERAEFEEKKEKVYAFMSDRSYIPMKLKELGGVLNCPKEEREDLANVVTELMREGKIIQDGRGRLKTAGADTKTGVFSGTQKGFGFVIVEGEKEDIFIGADNTMGARDKDTVVVSLKEGQSGRSREGVVVSILSRNPNAIIGTFQRNRTTGFVIPDNQKFGSDIYIPKGFTKGAVDGHKVEVEIIDYGNGNKNPEGKIVRIIGHINDPGVDIMSVILANGIPTDFPDGVMNQLDTIPEEVDPADMEGRLDCRDMQMVTIDGEDAKDLDDAVALTKEDGIYKLSVHIADVTNYVKEGSPLDKEASKRGTSVYLVDRVIPMIPHKLSNGICSLNEGVDRLALSCFMDIDEKGNVIGHKIAETVVKIDKRMSYTSVKKIIEEHDPEECEKYKELVPMFELMAELAEKLRARRMKRGSIDFDFPECKILVDENCNPYEIKPYDRNKATRLIEDFMLITNETIAEDFYWQELPFVYRTHENPDPEKIVKLGVFINNFGYSIKMGQEDIHPKELQKLLQKIEGTDEEALISRLTLRSMKQAKYTVSCEGHFGLAAKYYCHFTSPIRRYPDLQIHRIIKENLAGKLDEKRIAHYDKILPEVTLNCSKTERRADDAEREVDKLKKCQYMEQFIGQTFEGAISGVTNWGMYVELPNTVEGVIRAADMEDDYYFFDEEHYQMIGEHTKNVYKLGQRVKVKLVNADRIMKLIEFRIVGPEDEDSVETDREIIDRYTAKQV